MNCAAIRILYNARQYLFRYYGGVESARILGQKLQQLNPTPYVCGICGGRHDGVNS